MTLGSMIEHQRGVGAHSHHHHHRHSSRDRAGNVSPLPSPTHTADIHDFDTRDLTSITAGGIGTMSPSPPLTTSLSPGTSITSSPQHFYPGGRQTDDEEQEYTTAVTEQRGTPGTGRSQHQSPYRHQNTGQSNYGNTQSRQFPHHIHITTSQTQTTTRIITQHPTTLPRSNTSKSKYNASNRMQQSDRKSNQFVCRHDWQRSASCRNLHTDSRFEKGQEGSTSMDPVRNGRVYYESVYRQERLTESPITRYDDSRRVCYSAAGSKTHSVDRGSGTVSDTRIYSSSYPGTTSSLSTESGGGDEPGGLLEAGSECILLTTGGMDSGSQEEILYSHDDLSHDSYELLEREGEEEGDDEQEEDDEGRDAMRRRIKSYAGTRSCSLESGGDILPLDDVHETSGIGHDDMAVFQMDEIETVGSGTYVTPTGDESNLESVLVELQSIGTDINEGKVLDFKLDDRNVTVDSRELQPSLQEQLVQFQPHEHKGFDGTDLAVKTIRDEESVACVQYEHRCRTRGEECMSSSDEHIARENDGLTHTGISKQAQTHFLEYNAKCKPGLVIGFDSREEVLISGGRNVSNSHTPVERAKSDPHTSSFRTKGSSKRKRRVLTHQKSIDLSPADSGESDDEGEGGESARYATTMAVSHSEYNIPYTLHKRHAMNGTAPTQELAVPHPVEMLTDDYKAHKSEMKLVLVDKHDGQLSRMEKNKTLDSVQVPQLQSSDSYGCFEMAEKVGKRYDGADTFVQIVGSDAARCDTTEISKVNISQDVGTDDDKISEVTVKSNVICGSTQIVKTKNKNLDTVPKVPSAVTPGFALRHVASNDDERGEKSSAAPRKSKVGPSAELPAASLLPRKRERSPILFARARLGLSEGSAFSPVHQIGSPASSRRTKSLDAAVVAVHRLPPADAFSSKDDTLDNGIGKSDPVKPLEIAAKRLPSTIEDENGISEENTQDLLDKQVEQEPQKQTAQPLRNHTASNIVDKVVFDSVLDSSQLGKCGLPPQNANLKLSSSEIACRFVGKDASSVIDKEKVIYKNEKETVVSNKEEPVKSAAVQEPQNDAVVQQLPIPVDVNVRPQTEVCISEVHVNTRPQIPYKPANLKPLRGDEDAFLKGKSEQIGEHVCVHSAVKCFADSKNEQSQERVGKDKSEESHPQKINNLKSPQGTDSENDARHENVLRKMTNTGISSAEGFVSDTVVDMHQELLNVSEDVSCLHSGSNISYQLDQHFKEKGRKILRKDKDGSSGDYQTFDDIELPPEIGYHPISVHPEAVIKELSNKKKHVTESFECSDPSFMSKHMYQTSMKESTSLKLYDSAWVPVVPEASLPVVATDSKSESHIYPKTGSLDLKVETQVAKAEAASLRISEIEPKVGLVSLEKQSICAAESEISLPPASKSQFVPSFHPEKRKGEGSTSQIPEKNEIPGTSLVSAILPDTSLSEADRKNFVVPAAKVEYQKVLSKDWQISGPETFNKRGKARQIEIIKIENNSLEKEEALATSDDEIPAIPLDEEGSILERWVSVEDIHEELLAADHALKGALDLGQEFEYIDEEERRSPDTCSDYDNLSSSPSSHVHAQNIEPPLEQAEEFVEIELDRGNSGQRKGDGNGTVENISGTKTHSLLKADSDDKTVILAEEKDSPVRSLETRDHMAETAVGSKEVKDTAACIVDSELTVERVVGGRMSPLSLKSNGGHGIQREQEQVKMSEGKESLGNLVDSGEQTPRSLVLKEENQQSIKDNVGLVRQREVTTGLQENKLDGRSKRKWEERIVVDESKDNSDTLKPEQKPLMGIDSPESVKDSRDEESPESMKDDKIVAERSKSEEEASSSSSLALPARVELSSTWRPFLLESSGSSSLEEGFFPPDEEETTSSPSNNGREEAAASIDFPATFGYPCIGDVITSVGGYGGPGVFALSRTLSRISERSTTSEQERSDLDDDSTKPSSRSPSVDDESLLSSDHQPSLSSDPPSGGPTVDEDVCRMKPPDVGTKLDTLAAGSSPSNMCIPPPLLSDDDWPSPPTSSSLFGTPVVSHVETFYMEIHPEEACKVMVIDSTTDQTGGDGSSTDENHTLQDEDDDFLSGECLSSSAATLDGTVKVAVRPKCPSHYCTGSSLSEDTSMGLSLSEWSSSTSTVRPQCPLHYSDAKSDSTSLDDLGRSVPDLPTSSRTSPNRTRSPSYYSGAKSDTCLDDCSPTRLGKPTSGQKSRITFHAASKSLTNVDTSFDDVPVPVMSSERPVKVVRPKCTPYYSTAHSDEGDRMLERAVSRQGITEEEPLSQSLEAPTGWSNERSVCTHSVQQITGPKVKSKCYSYYSTAAAARSPQSDGDTSSSLDGSSVTERVTRAPKRRKSQPKKRHRVTVDLEVRDGQIVEVSTSAVETLSSGDQSQVSTQGTADSTSTVMFVPKQSSV